MYIYQVYETLDLGIIVFLVTQRDAHTHPYTTLPSEAGFGVYFPILTPFEGRFHRRPALCYCPIIGLKLGILALLDYLQREL